MRVKYHVVEEPADHGKTFGSVPYTSRTATRIACGRRSRIEDDAGSNTECLSTFTSPNPLLWRKATTLSKVASGRCPGRRRKSSFAWATAGFTVLWPAPVYPLQIPSIVHVVPYMNRFSPL